MEEFIVGKKCEIASIIGRYYSMDRDSRWERTKLAYDLICNGKGKKVSDFISEINYSYEKNCTDEFLKPMVNINEKNLPIGSVEEGDVIVFFNFRTDRGRQLTRAMTQKQFNKFETKNSPNIQRAHQTWDDESAPPFWPHPFPLPLPGNTTGRENAKHHNKLTHFDDETIMSLTAGARYSINEKAYVGAKVSYMEIDGPDDGLGIQYEDIELTSFEIVVGTSF